MKEKSIQQSLAKTFTKLAIILQLENQYLCYHK